MPVALHAYLVGPLVAFAVVGVLALILWWTFGRDGDPLVGVPVAAIREPGQQDGAPADEHEDYGLLRPALVADDLTSAGRVRAQLAEAGIRATLSTGLDGRTRVLVFGEELDRARRVVGG
jgi:hypothetical protein